jgi:hypothetical protein
VSECLDHGRKGRADGYSQLNDGKYLHRVVYEEVYGTIPVGLIVHHDCENRRCVNPEHLSAITQSEHIRLHSPRRYSVRTECPKCGSENLRVEGDGTKRCRPCESARKKSGTLLGHTKT